MTILCFILYVMNWLIISSDDCKKESDKVVDFLNSKNVSSVLYNVSAGDEENSGSLDAVQEKLEETTHCIVLLKPGEFAGMECVFTAGYLFGKQIPSFVCKIAQKGSHSSDLEKSVWKNFEKISGVSKLVDQLDENFPKFMAEEEKRIAHKKLFDEGIPFTPDCFSFHIAKAHEDVCNLFLDAGMDVNSRDSAGTPMLCIAARSGRKNMIEWLVSKGADVDAVSEDRGYSPVMDAVWKSSPEIVELLIKLGANLNFVSNDGQTALILATGASNVRICEMLVKNGADPNVKDRMGMSSLEYARLFKKTLLIPLYEEYAK